MLFVALWFSLAMPSTGLDSAGIEAAIAHGESAASLAQAPALLQVAQEKVAEGTYVFYAGTCRHWVAHLAWRARQAGRALDMAEIEERCLGRDELRVVVTSHERDALGEQTELPRPEERVTDLRVRLGGREYLLDAPERFTEYGSGNGFGTFGPLALEATSDLMLTATLASGSSVSVKLKKRQLAQMF